MGFADVDQKDGDLVLVRLVDALQIARLATERRSGVAAEDEDGRAASGALVQSYSGDAIERRENHVGRLVSDDEIPFASLIIADPVPDVLGADLDHKECCDSEDEKRNGGSGDLQSLPGARMHRGDHSIGGREYVFIAGMESEAIRSDGNSI